MVTLHLIAPSKKAWDESNQSDTHLFGLDIQDLEFSDGTHYGDGRVGQTATGPLAKLEALALAVPRAQGWMGFTTEG